jgi:hypothetical protein
MAEVVYSSAKVAYETYSELALLGVKKQIFFACTRLHGAPTTPGVIRNQADGAVWLR